MNREIVENIILELRRGSVIIAVLSQLNQPQYGYSLIQNLNIAGFKIDQGTLYPMLRRLESQEILKSSWDTSESRPKKYYEVTSLGKTIYLELINEFENISKTIFKLKRE